MVLDSWAVIAWLKDQRPAADRVDDLFQASAVGELRLSISVINWGEIYYLTAKYRDFAAAATALASLKSYRVAVLPASNETVMQAARLKARWPISYADAFAAAAALKHEEKLVTGDEELRPLGVGEGLLIEWIGAA